MRQNAGDSMRIVKGIRQARRLLKTIKPDVVFVKGGFVGLPVGLAAAQLKIPLIIHESDTVMGLTNRVLARRAQLVATGFPVEVFDDVKLTAPLLATGNPVREDILAGRRERGRKHFGLDTARPTVLIIGGLTGAQAINEVVFGALAQLTESVNIIHQTGHHDIDAALFQRQRLTPLARRRYVPQAFLRTELADAYALADVVVTRCGANVLAELAALKKVALLIPLPGSANNHQAHNAHYIVRRGAARLLEQSRLTPRTLRAEIDKLIDEPSDRRYLEEAIGKLAVRNAAELLAEAVVRVVEQRRA
jgi:UDP-N-acetylglucosamine--N-acetylmuramyl-(pentapeptide) pyrophosphoryl-undecaprenol N-acetylglucosamine transferase